jgi:subtilisin family serine protease
MAEDLGPKRSGFGSISYFLMLICLGVALGELSQASTGNCSHAAGLFSTTVNGAGLPENGSKKLSQEEFGQLPILPTGAPMLAKGTELNVVVDIVCLIDEKRGPQQLQWLRDLQKVTLMTLSENRSGPQIISGLPLYSSNLWTLEADTNFLELQQTFESEPCVDMVSPERRFYISDEIVASNRQEQSFNDPFIKDQTHLQSIHYAAALPEFYIPMLLRREVIIATIDTGVDFHHPDLWPNRWINRKEIPANGLDDDRNGFVDDVNGFNFASDTGDVGPEGDWPENRHGTHVAGLAAARVDNGVGGVGVAGVAKVMALNVFGRNSFTRSSTLENAIRYAANQGAEIINMSLGGREYSRTMRAVLRYAVHEGSFIVTASGNDGAEICDDPLHPNFVSPAVYGIGIEGMIVTASVDASTGNFSQFSNYSAQLVDIASPGAATSEGQVVGLLSTLPGNGYGYMAGTSMSAPVLSGAAALVIMWMRAYGKSVTPARLEQILKESARTDERFKGVVQEGRVLDLNSISQYLRGSRNLLELQHPFTLQ